MISSTVPGFGEAPAAAAPSKSSYKPVYTGVSSYDTVTKQVESSFSGGHQFLTSGRRIQFPGEKYYMAGRLLPAFHPGVPVTDPRAPISWMPYRVGRPGSVGPDQMDTQRNVPSPSPWFLPWYGIRLFNQKHDIVSPKTLAFFGVRPEDESAGDVLEDLKNYIWKIYRNDPDKRKHWLDKPQGKQSSARIPSLRQFALMNFWGHGADEKNPKVPGNCLVAISIQGFGILLDDLAYPPPHGSVSRDANFPETIYGDITNPSTGLWATAMQVQSAGSATTPFSFVFSESKTTLNGARVVPVGDDVLAARTRFTREMFNIPTQQEYVNMVRESKEIPVEFLREIRPECDIPDRKNATHFPATGEVTRAQAFGEPQSAAPAFGSAPTGQPHDGGQPSVSAFVQPTAAASFSQPNVGPGIGAMPPLPQAAGTMPPIPQAAPPPPEPAFWVLVNNQPHPEAVPQSRLAQFNGDATVLVANEALTGGQWKPLAQFLPPVGGAAVVIGSEYVPSQMGGQVSQVAAFAAQAATQPTSSFDPGTTRLPVTQQAQPQAVAASFQPPAQANPEVPTAGNMTAAPQGGGAQPLSPVEMEELKAMEMILSRNEVMEQTATMRYVILSARARTCGQVVA